MSTNKKNGVICYVLECNNNYYKTKENKISYYNFPKDENIKDQWIEFCNRQQEYKRHWVICSDHFSPDQFERDFRAELLGLPIKKKLIEKSVPHIRSIEPMKTVEETETFPVKYEYDEDYDENAAEEDTYNDEGITTIKDLENVNWIKICRLCLTEHDELFSIWEPNKGKTTIMEKIKEAIDIEIIYGDNLPSTICSLCLSKVDIAFTIRKEFKEVDTRLKNMLSIDQLDELSMEGSKEKFSDNPDIESYNAEHLKAEKHVQEDVPYQETVTSQQDSDNELIEEDGNIDCEDEYVLEQIDYVEINPDFELKDIKVETLEVENDDETSKIEEEHYEGDVLIDFIHPEDENGLENLVIHKTGCYICDEVFATDSELEDHLTQHLEMVPYTCSLCVASVVTVRTLAGLNKHLKMHQMPFKCGICDSRFSEKSSRNRHQADFHNGKRIFSCEECGKSYTSLKYFTQHQKYHLGESKHQCTICMKSFNSGFTLRRHLLIHTGEKPFECKICGKMFNHVSNFKDHKRRHTGERPFHCDECPFKFVTSTALKLHKNRHLEGLPNPKVRQTYKTNQTTKEYDCTVCGKICTNKRSMWAHNKTHNKQHECEICHHKFPNKSMLKDHENSHNGTRPYICALCGMSFSRAANFYRHKRVHTGEKRFICEMCGKAFAQKENAKVHMRIHTGEKPYKCKSCDKHFADGSTLKKHELRHVNEFRIAQLHQEIEAEVIRESIYQRTT